MDWHQFLRDERTRKLGAIERLSSGSETISVRTDGELRDVTSEAIADHQRHIAEIEEILLAADEPIEAV